MADGATIIDEGATATTEGSGCANSTSWCAAPNILKDVRVRLTYTDIKDIANNHARTLADFFIPPPVSRASSSSGCAAPQHP
jgi:hypothetical protein